MIVYVRQRVSVSHYRQTEIILHLIAISLSMARPGVQILIRLIRIFRPYPVPRWLVANAFAPIRRFD
jgi:hypothetical protein